MPGARGSGRLRDDHRTQFRIRREDTVEADQVKTRVGHQGCQAFHEVDRRHLEMGGAVAPGCLEFERHARGAVPAQLVVGEGRAHDGGWALRWDRYWRNHRC